MITENIVHPAKCIFVQLTGRGHVCLGLLVEHGGLAGIYLHYWQRILAYAYTTNDRIKLTWYINKTHTLNTSTSAPAVSVILYLLYSDKGFRLPVWYQSGISLYKNATYDTISFLCISWL